jgi:hypothetical protein
MKLFCTTFRSSILKACALLGFIAAAPLAVAIPAHAQTPNQLLYFYSGLVDSGAPANIGSASAIHCSNFSGVSVAVQWVVFSFQGTLVANAVLIIPHQGTRTVATHQTSAYAEDLVLNTGFLAQGLAAVVASNPAIVCTAQVLDASALAPTGIALHGVRYNPIPGTQE